MIMIQADNINYKGGNMSIQELLKSANGRFFSVTFIKKDGTLRKLVGRFKVTKHLKGGGKSWDHVDFLTVFDVKNKGYRTVNCKTIKEAVIDKKRFKVIDNNVYQDTNIDL